MRDRAIKGKDDAFEFGLGEALQRIEENTIDDGYVAIMFTHQSTQVYAALVNMLLQTNLRVLNAWSVSTETEAGGLKEGNYVQSTVTIVLQKAPGKNLSVDERARYIYSAPKGSIILLHSKERDMDALSKALPVLLKHYGMPAH